MKAQHIAAFALLISTSKCAPVDPVAYLRQFGYLEQPSGDKGMDHVYDYKPALREFQKMCGLEETGWLDAETTRLMETPRCGVPDIFRGTRRKRFLGDRWDSTKITYSVFEYPQGMYPPTTKSVLANAFDTWRKISPLTFERLDKNDRDANIKIGFSHGTRHDKSCKYPFGNGKTVAHAYFPQDGRIHFNMNYNWDPNVKSSKSKKLASVALHEIGHAIGLVHTDDESSVMFPYYSQREVVITKADEDALKKLYGTATLPSADGVVVTPVEEDKWLDNDVDVRRYSLRIVNNTPNTVTSISLRIDGVAFDQMWNLEQSEDTNIYKTPNWLSIPGNGGTYNNIGFAVSGKLDLSVVAYE